MKFIEKDFNDGYGKHYTIAEQINMFQEENNCEFVHVLSSVEQQDTTYTKVLFKKLTNEN